MCVVDDVIVVDMRVVVGVVCNVVCVVVGFVYVVADCFWCYYFVDIGYRRVDVIGTDCVVGECEVG